MIMIVLLTFFALALIGVGGFWLAIAGGNAGDLAIDARTRLVATPGRAPQLVVTNPGPEPVVVGMTARRHLSHGIDPMWSQLVVRPARWYERRQDGRLATSVLGVVEPRGMQRWDLPVADEPSRVIVVLSQGGGRVRIHEHLAGPNDPGSSFVDAAA
jgi:hypothetical protein